MWMSNRNLTETKPITYKVNNENIVNGFKHVQILSCHAYFYK